MVSRKQIGWSWLYGTQLFVDLFDNSIYHKQPKGRSWNRRSRDQTFHLFSRVHHRSSPLLSAFPPSLNDLHVNALNIVRSECVNSYNETTLEFKWFVTVVRVDQLTCAAIV
jgi:hypothetical protein